MNSSRRLDPSNWPLGDTVAFCLFDGAVREVVVP